MPGKLVSKISKRECFTLSEVDTVKIASQKMHEKEVGSMPVINKNNDVIGIVSERDTCLELYTGFRRTEEIRITSGHDPNSPNLFLMHRHPSISP